MSKVTVIFVYGDGFIDKIIDGVTDGIYSHTAIKILGGVVEALGVKDPGDDYPGIWLHPADKYDNNPNAKFIDVEIPDLSGAEETARKLIGKLYGYTDCIVGGLHDITGLNIPGDGDITDNCSETVPRILRGGGLNILPGIYADDITPNHLYRVLEGGK